MRFIFIYKYGIFQKKTERVDIENCTNTSQLIQFLQKKVSKTFYEFIVRIRKDKMPLKIIKGWPLEQYDLRDGAQIEIDVPEKEQEQIQKLTKNRYLLNLLGNKTDLTKIAQQPEQRQSFISQKSSERGEGLDIRKYLDSELQKLLKQVQKGNLNNFISILEQIPQKLDEESILEIQVKKSQLINQLGEGGWGTIHYAIFCNKMDILKQLIKRDINLNRCTNDGWLPLQLAVTRKNYQILSYLLSQKSLNKNEMTIKGTAFHCAARLNDIQSMKILITADIDHKILDENGKSAMQITSNPACQNLIKQYQQKLILQQENKDLPQQQQQKKIILTHDLLKGPIYKVRTLFNQSQRYLVLDPFEGTLIIYQSQDEYPKKPKQLIPISTVKKIRILKQDEKNWPLKKQFTYFELYNPSRMILGCKFQQIAEKWVRGIYDARFFLIQLEKDKTLKDKLQKRIFILNDHKNEIIQQNKKQKLKPAILQRKKTVMLLQVNKQPGSEATQSAGDTRAKTNSQVNSSNASNQNKSFQGDSKQKTIQTNSSQLPVKPDEKNIQDQKQLSQSLTNLTNDDKITFSSFQVLKTLGSGSFGKVFLVRHISTNKYYALKALKKKTLIVKKQLKYAIAEANVLKKANHPFIINLHYAFQTPNYLYLALDYCPGKDLSFHLAREVLFTEDQSRFYIAQLLLAIEHLHQKNIIYRDLKPENILLDAQGHIKLADFGLSKDNVQDKTKSFCGSPAYLSPEMLAQKGVGKQSDLYGLGCVLYEFLVGEPPYYSDDIPELYKNIKQAKLKFPKGISQEAKSIISGLLERDPRKRLGYKNKDEIKNHAFFEGLNWSELLNQKIKPPQRNTSEQQEQQNSDEQIQLLNKGKTNFTDYDYDDSTKKINRLINFSFIRNQEEVN